MRKKTPIDNVICFDCRQSRTMCKCNAPVTLCGHCYSDVRTLRGMFYCGQGCGFLKGAGDRFETTERERRRLQMLTPLDPPPYPRAGFTLLGMVYSILIFGIILMSFLALMKLASQESGRLANTLNEASQAQYTRICPLGKPCGVPILCIKVENNQKDISYCDGQCIWSGSNYTLGGVTCLEVLSR